MSNNVFSPPRTILNAILIVILNAILNVVTALYLTLFFYEYVPSYLSYSLSPINVSPFLIHASLYRGYRASAIVVLHPKAYPYRG